MIDILLRQTILGKKMRFGDFEIDTMIYRNHKGAIMTTNDMCTHLVLLLYKDKIHAITADNGMKFARYKDYEGD